MAGPLALLAPLACTRRTPACRAAQLLPCSAPPRDHTRPTAPGAARWQCTLEVHRALRAASRRGGPTAWATGGHRGFHTCRNASTETLSERHFVTSVGTGGTAATRQRWPGPLLASDRPCTCARGRWRAVEGARSVPRPTSLRSQTVRLCLDLHPVPPAGACADGSSGGQRAVFRLQRGDGRLHA